MRDAVVQKVAFTGIHDQRLKANNRVIYKKELNSLYRVQIDTIHSPRSLNVSRDFTSLEKSTSNKQEKISYQ